MIFEDLWFWQTIPSNCRFEVCFDAIDRVLSSVAETSLELLRWSAGNLSSLFFLSLFYFMEYILRDGGAEYDTGQFGVLLK